MANETTGSLTLDMAAAERDARQAYQLWSAGVAEDAPEYKAVIERLNAAAELMSHDQLVSTGVLTAGVNTMAEFMDLIRRNRTHGNQ